MRKCNRCGNQHDGALILAPLGIRVLFQSEWESECAECDLEFQFRNQVPFHRVTNTPLASFIASLSVGD